MSHSIQVGDTVRDAQSMGYLGSVEPTFIVTEIDGESVKVDNGDWFAASRLESMKGTHGQCAT